MKDYEEYIIEQEIDPEQQDHKFDDILELRKREEYLRVDGKCPRCDCFTLEYQIYGYEKNIFCTNCIYSKTITLS